MRVSFLLFLLTPISIVVMGKHQSVATRGMHLLLDAEAKRIVSIMPLWIPAEHEGEKVASKVTIPISFNLPKTAN